MKSKGKHIELRKTLAESGSQTLLRLFQDKTLEIEIYRPSPKDLQKPHSKDEVYIIISGTGTFSMADELITFSQGDFIFVPAGMEHRFETFSEDFATWVIFYGKEY